MRQFLIKLFNLQWFINADNIAGLYEEYGKLLRIINRLDKELIKRTDDLANISIRMDMFEHEFKQHNCKHEYTELIPADMHDIGIKNNTILHARSLIRCINCNKIIKTLFSRIEEIKHDKQQHEMMLIKIDNQIKDLEE